VPIWNSGTKRSFGMVYQHNTVPFRALLSPKRLSSSYLPQWEPEIPLLSFFISSFFSFFFLYSSMSLFLYISPVALKANGHNLIYTRSPGGRLKLSWASSRKTTKYNENIYKDNKHHISISKLSGLGDLLRRWCIYKSICKVVWNHALRTAINTFISLDGFYFPSKK
jgi:hypothetical protein